MTHWFASDVSFYVDLGHVATRDGSPSQPHGARQISRNYVDEFTVSFHNGKLMSNPTVTRTHT